MKLTASKALEGGTVIYMDVSVMQSNKQLRETMSAHIIISLVNTDDQTSTCVA